MFIIIVVIWEEEVFCLLLILSTFPNLSCKLISFDVCTDCFHILLIRTEKKYNSQNETDGFSFVCSLVHDIIIVIVVKPIPLMRIASRLAVERIL